MGYVACIAKPKSTQVYQILVVLGVQDSRPNIYPYIYIYMLLVTAIEMIPNNLASAAV